MVTSVTGEIDQTQIAKLGRKCTLVSEGKEIQTQTGYEKDLEPPRSHHPLHLVPLVQVSLYPNWVTSSRMNTLFVSVVQ